jgi:glycosyltransferase involved in cell wall biosynthesis
MHPAVPGRRLVLTLHDVITESWPDEGALLFGADDLLGRAAAVITVSETSRKNILRRFPAVAADRVHVIWNGVDHASFGPDRLPGEAHRLQLARIPSEFLLYVGGITKRKNVAALVDAHARLREAQPSVPPLVLVGPWGRHQLIEALGGEPGTGILALGSVSAGTVPALMRHAAVVAAPSRDEGFGLPLLEAQACGARVVCSDIPVFREIGGAAPVYAEPTSDGLARGLQLALGMGSDEVERRRRAGFVHSRAFTWDRSAAQHLEVYRHVASGAAA